MAHLRPVTWHEVATKDDLKTVETTVRSEMHLGFAELRSEMNVGFVELRSETADAMTRQIKWMVMFAAAWSSLLIAAVRLIP